MGKTTGVPLTSSGVAVGIGVRVGSGVGVTKLNESAGVWVRVGGLVGIAISVGVASVVVGVGVAEPHAVPRTTRINNRAPRNTIRDIHFSLLAFSDRGKRIEIALFGVSAVYNPPGNNPLTTSGRRCSLRARRVS